MSTPVGKGVKSGRVLFADMIDMAPAIVTTWALASSDAAPLSVAFALGFVAWLLSPVTSRALIATSVGGMLTDLRWVRRDRSAAGFAATLKHVLFSQAYACFALSTWAMFALVFPWRLLSPATYKAFDVPNTELFGILVDRSR